MKYVTLDTGLNGAMILYRDAKPVDGLVFEKMGRGINLPPIIEKLNKWKPEIIYIEGIPTMPHQGVKQTATQWFVFGQCETIAELYSPKQEIIPAIRWASFTKKLSINPSNPSKVIAQELVEKFYPSFIENFRLRKYRGVRKVHDGIADCLCINMYIARDNFLDFLTP